MNAISTYQTFLKNYQLKEKKLESRRIADDKSKFSSLFNSYRIFQQLINRIDVTEARGYNLFDVIRVNHLEEKIHTPFIANLLDPKATHAQCGLFYDEFIKLLTTQSNKVNNFSCSDYSYLNVIPEKNTGSLGKIDILIYNTNPLERFAIIIENKIWALDQREQLSRYYNYAIENLKVPQERILLVYLTPFGNKVTEYSMHLTLSENLIRNNNLVLLSYKFHITLWLNNTLPFIKSIKVKQTIIQYLDTIKIICNE